MTAVASPKVVEKITVQAALATIAAGAEARDHAVSPEFPTGSIDQLRRGGLLAWNALAGERPPAEAELALVRAVAHADASIGRIFDGHLNGVERLCVQGEDALRDAELPAIRNGQRLVGVWGGEPRPEEGAPATIERSGAHEVLSGVKTFCSGAGGLDRALVLARDPHATQPSAVWIDVSDAATVKIDESWYRSSGLRASASHRVIFERAPILARFGAPGALLEQPWFARDALRTAATWAGIADTAYEAALAELRARPRTGEIEGLAVGRMTTAVSTIDVWLAHAARSMNGAGADLPSVALHARAAIAAAARTLLEEASRACGSHPFATGGALDRSRRDLELFLLQHRLDPMLARAGAARLEARA